MSFDDVIKLIQGVGFPVVVSGYLLFVLNNTLKENTTVLRDLKSYLEGKQAGGQ